MDHAGAVIGPLLAAAVLALGGSLPTVFLASAMPGVIVMVMLWLALPTLPVPAVLVNAPIHWSALDRRLWGLLGAALLLSFAAVPEAFLMIWAGLHGIAVAQLPLLWACTSVAKMLMAAPSGRLSDRFGRLPVLLVAWSGRVAVLASLGGAVGTGASVVALVVAYGACLAVAEPAERALIADVAPPAHRGTLYGAYYVVSGIGILPGATAFGALWLAMGPAIAFYAAAAVSAVAAIAMLWARAANPSAAE
jgi:MFS family permease